MKISETRELKICSVKMMCCELEKNPPEAKTIAVILSMEEVCHPAIGRLDDFLKINVYDTEIPDNPGAFKIKHAETVKEFLERERDFEKIYICCDSGESRSTAMAAAILRYFGCRDKEIWKNPYYHPNLLVYEKQLSAFGIRRGKLHLKMLKLINNRALKKAIKGK